ncbi:MAG TPA: LON peptidase substrate-binding domain-containing protein [Alphaproteobacteria bacterium]|nr:LON peptidase substrate-binding domain-containing protein [Alphaproteobacteria bacterium]
MSRNAFDPTIEELPATLPIFPLSGVLLLPGGRLPLNIFEPRYLAMTRDALKGDRLIGMVQPRHGGEEDPNAMPEVYPLGCAGRITAFNETDDGRYLITLRGLCRFEIVEEIAMISGYRRVRADFSPYYDDFKEEADGAIDRRRLLDALRIYFKLQNIKADWKAIEGSPDGQLVTTLAMACPFEPSEKQALLESPTLAERGRVITALFEMAALGSKNGEARH